MHGWLANMTAQNNPWHLVTRMIARQGFWWLSAMAGVLIISVYLSLNHWVDLHGEGESLSTSIRNVALVVAGVEALLLAAWRSTVAGRQADIAQQTLLSERYERGVAMLGHDRLAMRLGGIVALRRLAEEHPRQFHVQINRLLCNFVPKTTDREGDERLMSERELQAFIDAIGARRSRHMQVEHNSNYWPDLQGADLRDISIRSANLSKADLTDADLSGTRVLGVNLSGANLWSAQFANASLEGVDLSGIATLRAADLSGASLYLVDLHEALLSSVKLTGTHFTQVHGLTRSQLKHVAFDPEDPPVFNAVADATTGEQIDRLPNFGGL